MGLILAFYHPSSLCWASNFVLERGLPPGAARRRCACRGITVFRAPYRLTSVTLTLDILRRDRDRRLADIGEEAASTVGERVHGIRPQPAQFLVDLQSLDGLLDIALLGRGYSPWLG
jgi:hypothetical protein